MKEITFTAFSQQLKSYFDDVTSTNEPICISYKDGKKVVILSKSDYDSMEETFYLLKSPNNAMRLLKGIEDYEKGSRVERSLTEG